MSPSLIIARHHLRRVVRKPGLILLLLAIPLTLSLIEYGAFGQTAAAGKLPPTQSGLELSRKGVLVTAFGPNPDGEGTILRLWEQAGQDGVCKVKLPEGLRGHKPRLCDLRGRTIEGKLAERDGLLEVPLTHFAPTSILLGK